MASVHKQQEDTENIKFKLKPFLAITEHGLEINVPDTLQDWFLAKPEYAHVLRLIYLLRDFVKDARPKPEFAHISTEALEIYRDSQAALLMAVLHADPDSPYTVGGLALTIALRNVNLAENIDIEEEHYRILKRLFAIRYRDGGGTSPELREQIGWLHDNDKTFEIDPRQVLEMCRVSQEAALKPRNGKLKSEE
jgi:hypothetical protein